MRHALGLDRPRVEQYLTFLRDIAQLDFGRSYVQRIPAIDIIASRVP